MSDIRFYLVNVDDTELLDVTNIPDEEFKKLAHEQNLVFSLDNFQEAWNNYNYSDLNIDTQFLRILKH